jgi:hypothetical protein
MSFEIKGNVYKVFPTESKTASFQAREFVIEVDESNYKQFIKFQLTQDRCGLIDSYKEGDTINVHFDLRGREWQDKFFTNLNAWKIESVSASSSPAPADIPSDFLEMGDQTSNTQAEDFDDLPF